MAHDAAPAVAPVIAPTSSSMDVFLASRAATRFPIRSTSDAVGHLHHVRHRVADEDHRHPVVGDAADRVEHVACLHDAEGSGGLVQEDNALGPSDRACDGDGLLLSPDIAPTGSVRLRTVAPSMSSASCDSLRIAGASMKPNRPSMPFAGFSRPRNMFWAALRCGASAKSWKTVSIPRSAAAVGLSRSTGDPSNRMSPRIESETAGQRLHHRRLAGTVVADQRNHLAGVDVEVGAVERPDVSEASRQRPRFQDWRLRCSHAYRPVVCSCHLHPSQRLSHALWERSGCDAVDLSVRFDADECDPHDCGLSPLSGKFMSSVTWGRSFEVAENRCRRSTTSASPATIGIFAALMRW